MVYIDIFHIIRIYTYTHYTHYTMPAIVTSVVAGLCSSLPVAISVKPSVQQNIAYMALI